MGFDRSLRLAEITKSRGHEVFVCDCLRLPLRDGVADGVISIAVLHHLATRERRLQALDEMRRVLAPGGRALVTVWAKDQTKRSLTAYLKQDRKNRRKANIGGESCVTKCETESTRVEDVVEVENSEKSSKETKNTVVEEHQNPSIENTLQMPEFKLPVHTARTPFQHQDVFVPWKVKTKVPSDNAAEVFLRYYHVFEENELVQLCRSMKDINIIQTYYTEGNWCIVFEQL